MQECNPARSGCGSLQLSDGYGTDPPHQSSLWGLARSSTQFRAITPSVQCTVSSTSGRQGRGVENLGLFSVSVLLASLGRGLTPGVAPWDVPRSPVQQPVLGEQTLQDKEEFLGEPMWVPVPGEGACPRWVPVPGGYLSPVRVLLPGEGAHPGGCLPLAQCSWGSPTPRHLGTTSWG